MDTVCRLLVTDSLDFPCLPLAGPHSPVLCRFIHGFWGRDDTRHSPCLRAAPRPQPMEGGRGREFGSGNTSATVILQGGPGDTRRGGDFESGSEGCP